MVEDCVFDRAETTRLANLFDLDAKFTDVVPAREVIAYSERIR